MTQPTSEHMQNIARGMERYPACDCVSRSPSYPTYRESPHLPDCVWWRIEQIEERLERLAHAMWPGTLDVANTKY